MIIEHDIDRIVKLAFFLNENKGVFVEVGAARPDYLSLSASYRKAGWSVIAIEPNPDFCALHRAMGHDTLEYACSDQDQDDVEFTVVNSKNADYLGGKVSFESFSSLGIKDKFAEHFKQVENTAEKTLIKVKVRKLNSLLSTYYPNLKTIDVLAVDVEGWELNVLKGFDLQSYKPKVVIIENNFGETECRDLLMQQGYVLWKTFSPNEIYIHRDLCGFFLTFQTLFALAVVWTEKKIKGQE